MLCTLGIDLGEFIPELKLSLCGPLKLVPEDDDKRSIATFRADEKASGTLPLNFFAERCYI